MRGFLQNMITEIKDITIEEIRTMKIILITIEVEMGNHRVIHTLINPIQRVEIEEMNQIIIQQDLLIITVVQPILGMIIQRDTLQIIKTSMYLDLNNSFINLE